MLDRLTVEEALKEIRHARQGAEEAARDVEAMAEAIREAEFAQAWRRYAAAPFVPARAA